MQDGESTCDGYLLLIRYVVPSLLYQPSKKLTGQGTSFRFNLLPLIPHTFYRHGMGRASVASFVKPRSASEVPEHNAVSLKNTGSLTQCAEPINTPK